ncbi:MAG TPA: HEAT repeat domain-containing protein [Tepidisphaeraceae bacterium]|jgi:hypothetical protein
MAIQFACEQCGTQFSVKDEFAGRKTKCKKCQAIITIPLTSMESADDPVDLGTIAGLSATGVHVPDETPRRPSLLGGDVGGGLDLAPAEADRQTAYQGEGFGIGKINPLSVPDALRVPIALALIAAVLCVALYAVVFSQTPVTDGLPEGLRPRVTRLMAYHSIFLFILHVGVASAVAWGAVAIGCGIARDRLAAGSYVYVVAAMAPITIAFLLAYGTLVDPGFSAITGVTAPASAGRASGMFPIALVAGIVAAAALVQALLQLGWRATAYAAPAGVAACVLAWLVFDGALRKPVQGALLSIAGVDNPSRKKWDDEHPEETAKVVEILKAKEAERYEAKRRADPMLGRTDRLMAEINRQRGALATNFREDAVTSAEALRKQVNGMRPPEESVVWNELDAAMKELESSAPGIVSGVVPPEVFEPAIATKALPSASPAAGGVVFNVFGAALALPQGYTADLSLLAKRESEIRFGTKDMSEPTVIVRRYPLTNPRQQRPFVYSEPRLAEVAAREKLLGFESASPADAVQVGGGLMHFVRARYGGFEIDYYVARGAEAWVLLSTSGKPGAGGLTLDAVANALSPKADAAAVDPFAPTTLLARLADDRLGVTQAIKLMGGCGVTAVEAAVEAAPEDANLVALLRELSPNNALLKRIANEAAARAAAAQAASVDLPGELTKMRTGDFQQVHEAVKAVKIVEMKPERREEVANELERLFLTDDAPRMASDLRDAMLRWQRPQTIEILLPVISNERLSFQLQKPIIDIYAASKDKRAVFPVLRWLPMQPDHVIGAIGSMGPMAEDEVLKLLGDKNKNVRTHAARMLMSIGTKKCVPALTRAANDPRDLLAAATAKSALAQVRQRIDGAKAAPAGAGTQPGPAQP